jgi:hypothetical protein
MSRNRGKWSRWRRSSCEGYNLAIGLSRDLQGKVARNVGTPETWRASLGGRDERIFLDRETAMAHVEQELRQAMRLVLEDWAKYCAARGLKPDECLRLGATGRGRKTSLELPRQFQTSK